jgi:hypothetical protein
MDSQNVPPSPRQIRRAGPWRGLAVLALAASTAACGTKAPEVTGVIVTALFSGIDANQLEFSVSTSTAVALNARRLPVKATSVSLANPQSVSIYLPDTLAREMVTCTVTALKDGAIVGSGTGTGTLVLRKLVPVLVQLEAGAGDGAAPEDGGDGEVVDAPIEMPADVGAAGAGGQDGGGAETTPTLKGNGVPCMRPDECESTLCVDGVCCSSKCAGTCEACNLPNRPGTCSPEPVGTATPTSGPTSCANQGAMGCGYDGTCDGSGGCRKYLAGTQCKAESCNGSTYQPQGACDGQGTCVVPVAVDCKPYVCDTSFGPPACRATCRAGGADCAAPATCVANSCGAKVLKANGAGCVDGTDCTSGHCVDGVCCGMACTAACMSCNQTGKEGMCLPVPAMKLDPRKVCLDQGANTCGRNGLCDGAGGCVTYPATTVCAAASCSGRNLKPVRHCDGKGMCVAVNDVDCMPYRCDATTTACLTTCSGNSDCSTSPRRCMNGMCLGN